MIRAYLGIMQTRLGGRLQWSVAIPQELEDATLPPGMLITLVENAIKHGIEPSPSGGRVDVTASRVPHPDGARVALTVTDTGVGLASAPDAHGIGLANIRERLALLHGDRATSGTRGERPAGIRRLSRASARSRPACASADVRPFEMIASR